MDRIREELIRRIKNELAGRITDDKHDEMIQRLESVVNYIYIPSGCIPALRFYSSQQAELSFERNGKSVELWISLDGEMAVMKRDRVGVSYHEACHNRIHTVCEFVGLTKLLFGKAPVDACLFSGAFNPPTVAHYYMMNSALDTGRFSHVFVSASNNSFMERKQKRGDGLVYSENDRIRFLLAMTRDDPEIIIYGIENGYTYEMLKKVKKKYDVENLFFACGSDKLNEIDRWGFSKYLLSEFCFYVSIRGEDREYVESRCDELFSGTKYMIVPGNDRYRDISATQARTAIMSGSDNIRKFVNEAVLNELRESIPRSVS